jgi:hypothetical protein
LIGEELEQVRSNGAKAFVLAVDLPRLEKPPRARGVRLLGGYDPYVGQPDHDALPRDARLRKRMYPSVGRPGVVLHNGILVGLWRGRKQDETLEVDVEWLGRPVDIDAEAAAVARVRDCRKARVIG